MRNIPKSLILGGIITAVMVGAALLSRFWTPADPTGMNIMARLKAPGEVGLLGTDQIGRDVLSIIMSGAWTSLGIASIATLIGGG
ncbi:ABC transporter permease, partial [Celeribacter halophilus]